MRLCSACLLGVNCRHDGGNKSNERIVELSRKEELIPVCPEMLGGLPSPREVTERRGAKAFTRSGKDVTGNLRQGASRVLRIAKEKGIKEAILKQRSPSCASGELHDGTFAGKLIKGDGFTTELLRKNGIMVISEEDL